MAASIDIKDCWIMVRRHLGFNVKPSNGVYGDFTVIKVGEGDCTWDVKNPLNYKLDRGSLDRVEKGDEVMMDVSISCVIDRFATYQVASASADEVIVAMKNQLQPSDAFRGRSTVVGVDHPWNNLTTGYESEAWLDGAPYCTSIEIHRDLRRKKPGSYAPGEAYLLRYFRAQNRPIDVKNGTINLSGQCNMLRPQVLTLYPGDAVSNPDVPDGAVYWPYAVKTAGGARACPIPFIGETVSYTRSTNTYTLENSGALWKADPRALALVS